MPKTQKGKRRGFRYGKRKTFQRRVLDVVQSTRERKSQKQNFVEVSVTDNITNSSDLLNIMPDIRQGIADNEMIGQEILLKKITIRAICTGDVGTGTNTTNSNFLIRNMILKQRSACGSSIMDGNAVFEASSLLENDQAYIPSPTVDPNELYITPINKSNFISKWTQKFMLSMNQNQPNWTGQGAQPNATKFFTKTLTFGKGLKLHYDVGAVQPNNFPYFGAIVASAPWGDNTAAYSPDGHVFYKYQLFAEYTDA